MPVQSTWAELNLRLIVLELLGGRSRPAMLRSHSTELSAGTAAMPSLQELHTAAVANKLPNDDFEDMSLVFSTKTKR